MKITLLSVCFACHLMAAELPLSKIPVQIFPPKYTAAQNKLLAPGLPPFRQDVEDAANPLRLALAVAPTQSVARRMANSQMEATEAVEIPEVPVISAPPTTPPGGGCYYVTLGPGYAPVLVCP